MNNNNVYNMSEYRHKYPVKSYHKTVKELLEKTPDWLKVAKNKALEQSKSACDHYKR